MSAPTAGFMPLSEAVFHGYQAVTLDGVAATASGYPFAIGLGFVHKGALPGGTRAMRATGHVPVSH